MSGIRGHLKWVLEILNKKLRMAGD